jgi:hypothetical protein
MMLIPLRVMRRPVALVDKWGEAAVHDGPLDARGMLR